jgi:hypothetical protein
VRQYYKKNFEAHLQGTTAHRLTELLVWTEMLILKYNNFLKGVFESKNFKKLIVKGIWDGIKFPTRENLIPFNPAHTYKQKLER